MSKSGLEPTGDCDTFRLSYKSVVMATVSKSGLEPTGDCDAPGLGTGRTGEVMSKSGLEPTGDCDLFVNRDFCAV